MRLFTAEGERRSVPGWEPWFPLPAHVHERGDVWTTTASVGTTDVDISYDVTALSEREEEVVTDLREGFVDMLEAWQRLAQAALDAS